MEVIKRLQEAITQGNCRQRGMGSLFFLFTRLILGSRIFRFCNSLHFLEAFDVIWSLFHPNGCLVHLQLTFLSPMTLYLIESLFWTIVTTERKSGHSIVKLCYRMFRKALPYVPMKYGAYRWFLQAFCHVSCSNWVKPMTIHACQVMKLMIMARVAQSQRHIWYGE
jgi:hypothetical protein